MYERFRQFFRIKGANRSQSCKHGGYTGADNCKYQRSENHIPQFFVFEKINIIVERKSARSGADHRRFCKAVNGKYKNGNVNKKEYKGEPDNI